jgi:hypothetical protein
MMDPFLQSFLLNNRTPDPFEAQLLAEMRATEADSLDALGMQLARAEDAYADAVEGANAAERELVHRKRMLDEAAQCKWALGATMQSLVDRRAYYALILSPLRQLPDEVLAEVFLTVHASQVAEHDGPGRAKKAKAGAAASAAAAAASAAAVVVDCPLVLSQVSVQWRRVALSTPGLWTFVQIVASKWPFGRPLLEHYLAHSRSAPVRLTLDDLVRDTPVDDVFRFLRPHKARVADLHLRLEERQREAPFDFEDFLWPDFPFNAGTLRISDHSLGPDSFGAVLTLPHYNRIARLRLLNVSLDALAYVRESALAHLEQLDWACAPKAGPPASPDDAHALFSRAPALKRLHLENVRCELSFASPRIDAPHPLEHLSTRNTDHDVLPRIALPHLRTLVCRSDSACEACATVQSLGGGSAALTTLGLFELTYSALEPEMHVADWADALARLSRLERLHVLLDDYLFDVLMRALVRADEGASNKTSASSSSGSSGHHNSSTSTSTSNNNNLPSLRVIHIDARSVTPATSLLRFVRMRNSNTDTNTSTRASPNPNPLETVVLGSPDVLEPHALRELRELVDVAFARFDDASLYVPDEDDDEGVEKKKNRW